MIPRLIHLEKIGSADLGYLSVVEIKDLLPFEIKRVYWTYYTPNHITRGHHSHKKLQQFLVVMSGSIDFHLENKDGIEFKFNLSTPFLGLYVPPGYWRTLRFSHNAVLLCLASDTFKEEDYIRSYEEFKRGTH